jgi:hypothetical protein
MLAPHCHLKPAVRTVGTTLPFESRRSQCWHYLAIYKQPFAMVTKIDRMKEIVQSIWTNSSSEENVSECGTKVIFSETVLNGIKVRLWGETTENADTGSPFKVNRSESRHSLTISSEPFRKEARGHHLKDTVQHRCVRSHFKGKLSEFNSKLAI